ncbi:hypothetical protein KAR91_67260 [Candidatus Pacearchaeota archaeon]|nr:hypothetical protein [Candidatus Pacearchaeota archaeon]
MASNQCNRRTKSCRKCKRRFTKDEYELWLCPECGEDRHCLVAVSKEGQACRKHGGASLSGVAHPNAKHLRYSKHLPKHLKGNYEAALKNPEYLSMRNELALVETRLEDLVAQLGKGNTKLLFGKLGRLVGWLKKAVVRGDTSRLGELILELDELAKEGGAEVGTWKEIENVIMLKNGLVAGQARILVGMGLVITAEEQLTSVRALMEILKDELRDPNQLNRIGKRIRDVFD